MPRSYLSSSIPCTDIEAGNSCFPIAHSIFGESIVLCRFPVISLEVLVYGGNLLVFRSSLPEMILGLFDSRILLSLTTGVLDRHPLVDWYSLRRLEVPRERR